MLGSRRSAAEGRRLKVSTFTDLVDLLRQFTAAIEISAARADFGSRGCGYVKRFLEEGRHKTPNRRHFRVLAGGCRCREDRSWRRCSAKIRR
jgi:hypothetical protein